MEAVNELVNKGISFRDAYRRIGNDIEKGAFHFDYKKQLLHTHEGSIGNLCTQEIKKQMQKVTASFPFAPVQLAIEKLLK